MRTYSKCKESLSVELRCLVCSLGALASDLKEAVIVAWRLEE